jgi:hypothetical protein
LESSNNTVEGNFIGLDPTGMTAGGQSGGTGVFIPLDTAPRDNNHIGGPTPAARNVIANWDVDVSVGYEGYPGQQYVNTNNIVQGNYLGTNKSGTAAISNTQFVGIIFQSYGSGNAVLDNLISGHTGQGGGAGIYLPFNWTTFDGALTIQGNRIGTDATGNGPIPNGYGGVVCGPGHSINLGGAAQSQGNIIAYNTHVGVNIGSGNDSESVIAGNSIHDNGEGGILVNACDATVQNNNIYSNNSVGMECDNGNFTIQSNSVYNNSTEGIAVYNNVSDGHSATIQSNSICDNGSSGIEIEGANFTVQSNSVINNSGPGMVVYGDSSDLEIQGNIITRNGLATLVTTYGLKISGNGPGVWVQDSSLDGYAAGITIQSNAISGNGGLSIDLGDIPLQADGVTLAHTANEWVYSVPANNPGDAGGNQLFPSLITAQAATSSDANAFVAAINLLPAQTSPVTVTLNLGNGTYTDLTPTPPAGVTLVINGNGTTTVIEGHSPALTVGSGNVVIIGVTFITATDAPTILVTGGSLSLRNCTVEESTGFNRAAVEITGGTVDLGIAADPGGNTLNINGPGAFVHNTTSTPVAAVGDAFTVNGVALAPSTVQGLVYVDFNNDGQVDFGEKAVAGVTITLTGTDDLGNAVNRVIQSDSNGVYYFADLRPSNDAGYTVAETQPAGLLDGRETLGMVDGVPTGSAAVNDVFSGIVLHGGSLAENYNFGERPTTTGSVGTGQTAAIGFWQNKNGQNLIQALNGGATATQLGHWLATTFSNMYAALDGKTNAQVAAFYKTLFARTAQTAPGGPPKVDAQILATALAVYVTDQTLAGTTAAAYAFQVSATGVGSRTFNVGNNGAAFGVANNSVVSVMDLLLAVNARSHNGLLFDLNGNGQIDSTEAGYRTMANDLFSAINEAGGI